MLRRFRRPALVLASALALAVLSACGNEVVTASGGDDTEEGFDAFSLSGEIGSPPKIDWKAQMEADEVESKTIIEGDGPELATGDQVIINFTVGNGFTQKQTFSTYDEKPSGQSVTVDDSLGELFGAAINGQTVGSRVAVVASAEKAFGETGNPQLGIGNQDPVLMVFDLSSAVLDKPTGTQVKAPAWAPKIVFEKGEPTEFDFSRTPEPTDALQTAVLIEGEGPAVTKGQNVVVNYLGQVYGADKPFDESYSKEPYPTGIGIGAVVKGWDQGLVGQTVGSRVILAIPPKLGYGEEGNEGAGIGASDTLYFVVDILGAG
ncbi:MAG: FKBP-type peptidyl-prolyl cis-trans isomerase [Actinomycetota bacterium]|nr:FKBP-type peptidyl-prolyl cis-trans isomerase [Actinomycetota bacterium]